MPITGPEYIQIPEALLWPSWNPVFNLETLEALRRTSLADLDEHVLGEGPALAFKVYCWYYRHECAEPWQSTLDVAELAQLRMADVAAALDGNEDELAAIFEGFLRAFADHATLLANAFGGHRRVRRSIKPFPLPDELVEECRREGLLNEDQLRILRQAELEDLDSDWGRRLGHVLKRYCFAYWCADGADGPGAEWTWEQFCLVPLTGQGQTVADVMGFGSGDFTTSLYAAFKAYFKEAVQEAEDAAVNAEVEAWGRLQDELHADPRPDGHRAPATGRPSTPDDGESHTAPSAGHSAGEPGWSLRERRTPAAASAPGAEDWVMVGTTGHAAGEPDEEVLALRAAVRRSNVSVQVRYCRAAVTGRVEMGELQRALTDPHLFRLARQVMSDPWSEAELRAAPSEWRQSRGISWEQDRFESLQHILLQPQVRGVLNTLVRAGLQLSHRMALARELAKEQAKEAAREREREREQEQEGS
ncbi:hypothetical protein AB0N09_34660 [Streptomyces erythrochromogenes]|uniref:hypothetical protein n=1 Tax=Streptomyces erythrochromogenes TaxID=285574 RepID=UPI00342D145F